MQTSHPLADRRKSPVSSIRLFPLHFVSPSLHSLYDLYFFLCLWIYSSVVPRFPLLSSNRRPVAYISSWKLSLAIPSILPCIGIIGAFLGCFLTRYRTRQLNHQADNGSIAEEVIAAIRTAHAFGVQRSFDVLFDRHVELGHMVEIKTAVVTGIGLAGVFLPYMEPTHLVRPLFVVASTTAHSFSAF